MGRKLHLIGKADTWIAAVEVDVEEERLVAIWALRAVDVVGAAEAVGVFAGGAPADEVAFSGFVRCT